MRAQEIYLTRLVSGRHEGHTRKEHESQASKHSNPLRHDLSWNLERCSLQIPKGSRYLWSAYDFIYIVLEWRPERWCLLGCHKVRRDEVNDRSSYHQTNQLPDSRYLCFHAKFTFTCINDCFAYAAPEVTACLRRRRFEVYVILPPTTVIFTPIT